MNGCFCFFFLVFCFYSLCKMHYSFTFIFHSLTYKVDVYNKKFQFFSSNVCRIKNKHYLCIAIENKAIHRTCSSVG